jgi:serine/threonine protein kinase
MKSKTVAQIKEECKADGLVYDRDTKKCRPSKRMSKSPSQNKTVAQIKAECKENGLVYDRDTKKCRPSKVTNIVDIIDLPTIVPVGPGIPIEFNPIVDDCSINKSWNQGKLLGKGAYGSTYIACHINNPKKCNFVLKVQKDSMEFHDEVHALVDLKNTGVVVKIYAAWTCKGEGFIIMEKVFLCERLQDERKKYKKLERALEIILENDWLHLDIHPGNVMCKTDGSIVLIDFGYGVKKGKDSYPDHNFSKQAKDTFTFNELKIVQDWHAIKTFGEPSYPKYITYKKDYDDLMIIIHKRKIQKRQYGLQNL